MLTLPHTLRRLCNCTKISQSQPQQGLLAVLSKLSPFPKLQIRWKIDRDSRNLINPFMRVTNQMTRHFATLKASQLRLPLTRAQMSLLTLTFKAPGRIHILCFSKGHQQNAWFQLNCRIPLIVSVLLWHIFRFTHYAWKSNANRVIIRNAQQAYAKCRQSQSFSQGYRSNLPISLTYFIP